MTRLSSQQVMWGLFLSLGGLALMTLLSDPAFAQAAPTSQNFACNNGTASGSLIADSSSCPSQLKWDNIFSFLVCNIESMTSQIFGNMYCGVLKELQPAVKAALTLSVVLFGVGFTIGVIPATGREFITFLLKLAFIWAFATQAEYMIGYGYNFLVTGLREGTSVALSSIMPPNPDGTPADTAADMYGFLDRALYKIIGFASVTAGQEWGADMCQNAIFAALAIMAVAFPPIFLLSIMLFCKIIMVFLRACFGYLFSIVGIAFLMTLSPIFLSFALFKPTRSWFDKYLGYLASFTLQMVIVFTFIAMIISMNPSGLVGSMTKLVMPVQETQETAGWRWPWEYCTLCKFEIVEGGTVAADGTVTGGTVKDMSADVQINPATDALRCKTPQEPFRVLQAATPEVASDDVNVLMKFSGTAILSLIILAYIVDQLLFYVPSLAWRLASAMSSGVYAPQIAGGQGQGGPSVTSGPLELLETTGEGFYRGYAGSLRDEQGRNRPDANIFTATDQGMQEAGRSLLFGYESGGGRHDPGLVNGFLRFMVNPNGTESAD